MSEDGWALIRVSEFLQPPHEGVCARVLHDQLSCSQTNNCAGRHSDEGHKTGYHTDSEILEVSVCVCKVRGRVTIYTGVVIEKGDNILEYSQE